jgi:hypothetical protein
LRLVGGFITAEMGFHNILHQRHVALPIENVAMTKDCMLLRYQIYILISCEFVDDLQMGISIDFGNHGCAYRVPYCFVVFQQINSHHHGIDASAFLRLDWIVDEHSENVSLPERPWQDLDNQTLRTV